MKLSTAFIGIGHKGKAQASTSEAPPTAPAGAAFEWNETSFPPKPKETPTGLLYHFGALKGAA